MTYLIDRDVIATAVPLALFVVLLHAYLLERGRRILLTNKVDALFDIAKMTAELDKLKRERRGDR